MADNSISAPIAFRASGPISEVEENLGLLAELPGNWRGRGFNLIARPFFRHTPPFFLELNATRETLDFRAIGGDIPNRGSGEDDINLHGLRYLQQVTDCTTDTGIHIEPGLWIHVPVTIDPVQDETYVRQATIPHGDSLLAQSTFFKTENGGPNIQPVNSLPFTDAVIPGLNDNPANPVTNATYLAQYATGVLPTQCLPPGLNAAATIKDPTIVLRKAIEGQNIISTVVIGISTAINGGVVNIPFVQKNANAAQLDAIFWIETVQRHDGHKFVQLQYVQRVILDFIGIHWPHISVATLLKL
jgi:hypothetical protein